jgi:hypothetical protein
MADYNLTTGNDIFTLANSGDTVNGGGGNDSITTGAGSYTITLGSGADTVNAGIVAGDMLSIDGGDGNNNVMISAGSYSFSYKSGIGDETLYNSTDESPSDYNVTTIVMGDGAKTISLEAYANHAGETSRWYTRSISVGTGLHTLNLSGDSDNVITLGDGGGTIHFSFFHQTNTANNTITAGNGDHTITLVDGNQSITLGDGNNVFKLLSHLTSVAELDGGGVVKTGNGNNVILLGNRDSTVITGNGANTVSTGAGNSSIKTGSGADSVKIVGADGNMQVVDLGDGNNNVLISEGSFSYKSGIGDETLYHGSSATNPSGHNVATIVMGDGAKTISLEAYGNYTGETLRWNTRSISVGTGLHTLNLSGDGDNVITLGDGGGTIDFNSFHQTNTANNTITVGNGDHTITLVDGNQSITLGDGNNVFKLLPHFTSVAEFDNGGVVKTGNGNNVVLLGNRDSIVTTGSGADQIKLGNGKNAVDAGAGDDVITLGSGLNQVTFTYASGTNHDVVNNSSTDLVLNFNNLGAYLLIDNPDGSITYYFDANNTLTVNGTAATGINFLGQTVTLSDTTQKFTGYLGDDVIGGVIDGLVAANNTFKSTTVVDGGAGIDTLVLRVQGAPAALPAAKVTSVEVMTVKPFVDLAASNLALFPSVTTFNVDQSGGARGAVTVSNFGKGGVFGVIGDNSAVSAGTYKFGYASAANAATVNLSGGVNVAGITLTGTGVQSTVINAAAGAADRVGLFTNAATSKALTINAYADLTMVLATTATTGLTITGTGLVDLDGTAALARLSNTISSVNASSMTDGGVRVAAGNSTKMVFKGGKGADSYTTGAALATGASVDGGAGIDTLIVTNAADVAGASGAFYRNFDVLQISGTTAVDFNAFTANTGFSALAVTGGTTVSATNLSAKAAADVRISGNVTAPTLSIKGATTAGQADVMTLTISDGLAAVNTITVGKLSSAGLETLNIKAIDNAVLSDMTLLSSLTKVTVSGAGSVSLTEKAVALKAGLTIDANAATGAFTFDATGTTTNGFSLIGGSASNKVIGGAQAFTVNLSKSLAVSDVVVLTSAVGGTLTAPNATITGFKAAAAGSDSLDLLGAATVAANVTNAVVGTNLTASITSGVLTFGGSAAATATLATKINAALSATAIGTKQYNTAAFVHAGDTYVVEQGNTTAGYAAGADVVVKLVGVTDLTSLATGLAPASATANTLYIG